MDKKLKIAKTYTTCPLCGETMCDVSKIEVEEVPKENGIVVKLITYPCCSQTRKRLIFPKIREKERKGTKLCFRWTGECKKERYSYIVDHRTRILDRNGDTVRFEKKDCRKYNESFDSLKEARGIVKDSYLNAHKEHNHIIKPLYSYSYARIDPREKQNYEELWHKHHGFGLHKVSRVHRNRGKHVKGDINV